MLKRLLCKIVAKVFDVIDDREWIYESKIGNINGIYYVYNKAKALNTTSVRIIGKGRFSIPVISINTYEFSKFTKKEQEFIIYHELGHWKLNHFNVAERLESQEIEADMFAINIVGHNIAISTLSKLRRIYGPLANVEEINNRINIIRNQIRK